MKALLALALASAVAMAAPLDMSAFQQQDRDKDGYVDMIEVMGSVDLQGRFNDIDLDRDGRISAAEMQAWLAKPDKRDQLRDSAPIRPHEQWRELERRRKARQAEAAAAQPTPGNAATAPRGEAAGAPAR